MLVERTVERLAMTEYVGVDRLKEQKAMLPGQRQGGNRRFQRSGECTRTGR